MTVAEDAAPGYESAMFRIVVGAGTLAIIIGCSAEGMHASRASEFPRDSYPPAPYGNAEGDTLRNHIFTTPDDGALALQDIRVDADARLLLIVTAAGWCTACIEEQSSLQRLHEQRGPDGLRIVVTVFEDSEFARATSSDAREWRSDHALTFPVVADPEFQLREYYDASLTPMNMLIDIGPMSIERITTGWDPTLIESLVEAHL